MFELVFPFSSFESSMLVTRGTSRTGYAPVALTIGNFDGVHTGHKAILERLALEAGARRLQSCVMTFEPHPREFFGRIQGKPAMAPTRLTSLRENRIAGRKRRGAHSCSTVFKRICSADA
jgi:FAD synthase